MASHRCERVLVLYREPALPSDIVVALRGHGMAVLLVNRADLALEAIEDGCPIDALLIDFTAQDPSIADFLRHVKLSYALPVIALSPEVNLRRIGPTPDRELQKPVAITELVTALHELSASLPGPPAPSA